MGEGQSKFSIGQAFNAIGGVSGLLAISLVVWKGGAISQTVSDHDRRLAIVEVRGSQGLGEHVKYDDERVTNLNKRVDRTETLVTGLIALQTDVAVMGERVTQIQKLLEQRKP